MNKRDVALNIIGGDAAPKKQKGVGWSPVNIALCKYWGKRDQELNLPLTSSLSVSLDPLGAQTQIEPLSDGADVFVLNGEECAPDSQAALRVSAFLDLFRVDRRLGFRVSSTSDVPVAAGLASSASGFAALSVAIDDLFQLGLDRESLSILARLGSGSASRSLYSGFVEWFAGSRDDGMDSFSRRLDVEWPELCIGLLEISDQPKKISSRDAMASTVATSMLFQAWPQRVNHDLKMIKDGIAARDINEVGVAAEGNALAMHATMIDTRPSVLYWTPDTVRAIHSVWQLRESGVEVYLTMDAGPNVKLICTTQHLAAVKSAFPSVTIVRPFSLNYS